MSNGIESFNEPSIWSKVTKGFKDGGENFTSGDYGIRKMKLKYGPRPGVDTRSYGAPDLTPIKKRSWALGS